ncbi:NCAIR mutase (PurE)-related protein [Peribacillus deserti]|uniref:NCAIR mutase (PurE)-related protein n=1 Tax=Peribacillus deserti TaxID=673318 RepID=A0ABS2QEG3_9BACI|nr:nickel pincer cofactor biosynthesis protein LarB [Peribacillus deserti]MBM7691524.1 NCAIR mutase (PurE)-related protein [Peribacillus deserti]
MKDELTELLIQVQEGNLSVEKARQELQTYDSLGYATLDTHREKRTGFPEVIFGEGKSPQHLLGIFERLMFHQSKVLATRVDANKAEFLIKHLQEKFPDDTFNYHKEARTFHWIDRGYEEEWKDGFIAVVCAGTSDFPVAEEAVITAELMGNRVERMYDVGVAGIHRLLAKAERIEQANAIIVVAGMEGALASVMGGLVSKPVVAVPTSVGYGASMNGIAALLSMLSSCASGVSVVNIDNGFGAGYYAGTLTHTIDRAVKKAMEEKGY